MIVFSLESYQPVHVLQAHSTSVTCLQFDKRFIVTGGNDGRIKLWGELNLSPARGRERALVPFFRIALPLN